LDDGLRLTGAYIAAAARCAPPGNRPTPAELDRCRPHLVAEWGALPNVRVVVCLGRIGFDSVLQVLASRGISIPRPRPGFKHGGVTVLGPVSLVAAYHPSRQNTNTGKLTASMLAEAFATARRLAGV
jgi:uracil-DNA glycosylase family 4